jgi:hypothetical protein
VKLLQEVAVAAAKLIHPCKPEKLLARAGIDQSEHARKQRKVQSEKAIDSALIKTAVKMYSKVGQRSEVRRVIRALMVPP